MSKILTPILLSLSLAGTIVIPLSPVIFAGIAIMIARMGIAGFCADCPDDAKSKEKN